MAAAWEKIGADGCRDDLTERAQKLGHTMTWELAPNSNRKGHCYHWLGECGDCGATATAGSSWSSSSGIRDARRERCSGPGTAVLTEIEAGRVSELVADAVRDFGHEVSANRASRN